MTLDLAALLAALGVPLPWTTRPAHDPDDLWAILDASDIIVTEWLTEDEAALIVAAVNALGPLLYRLEAAERGWEMARKERQERLDEMLSERRRAEAAEAEFARHSANQVAPFDVDAELGKAAAAEAELVRLRELEAAVLSWADISGLPFGPVRMLEAIAACRAARAKSGGEA